MATVRYSTNNSGGSWWLTDEDWFALKDAGWDVDWVKDSEFHQKYPTGEVPHRFLGALATSATREGLCYNDAVAEFERVTGQSAYAEGCDCCGAPHEFYTVD